MKFRGYWRNFEELQRIVVVKDSVTDSGNLQDGTQTEDRVFECFQVQ